MLSAPRWTAGGALPSLRVGIPATIDTPPAFAEDARPCAGDAGRREAGGKELAQQKAEGQHPPVLPFGQKAQRFLAVSLRSAQDEFRRLLGRYAIAFDERYVWD